MPNGETTPNYGIYRDMFTTYHQDGLDTRARN